MRVLVSVAEMATGGAERIVVELTRALRADGDEVAVAADSGPFDRLLEGSGAVRYPLPGRGRSPLKAARAALRVRSATRRFRPGVIHSHNVKATGVAASARLATRGPRIPLLATFHGVRREEYRRAALVLRLADAVACVSQDLLEGLGSAGLPRESMRVIPNGVPVREPLSIDAREAIDRELGLGGGPVVSLVGRLVEQKAPRRFLESAAHAASELPDCHFLVVGDGPLRVQLEPLAERLGLKSAVRFTGVRRDARELIARSDLVAFSSDWEGLPMVALEALAAGVPVASTEVEGMTELLGTGAGVVVPRDVDALAGAIIALIRAPERRVEMGRTGRELIATEFSVDRMVSAYRQLYRELVRAPG
jgi:glycosyltransferase involved in cell wall biosynthesis